MPPIPIAGQVSHCDIKDWYEAWNKRDWVGVTRFLSPQFVLEDLALGRRIEGAAAYLTYAKTWARVFSDGEFKVE
ncbi:MAG: nuclear transport factor 2 family protein, partial [Deltaproteobacteria bacterium]|nr:nuclear transport factor 2 family protein [Deltaproteobacteria bacterium]